MNTGETNTMGVNILGLLAILLVAAVISGLKIPFISNEKVAMIALLVIGMAVCSTGIGRVASVNGWAHPVSIAGYVNGALILMIGAAALLGKSLPFIPDGRVALIVVLLLMIDKYVLTRIHPLLRKE